MSQSMRRIGMLFIVLPLAISVIFGLKVSKVSAVVDYSGGLLDGVPNYLYSGATNKGSYTSVTDNDEASYTVANAAGNSNGNNVTFINLEELNISSFRIKTDLTNFIVKFTDKNKKAVEISGSKINKNGELNDVNLSNITAIGIVNVGSYSGKVFEFNIYGEKNSSPIMLELKAQEADSQVTLNWSQVQDAESYTVRYGTEAGNYTETVTATKDEYGNYVIPGLTNGTTYYFVVTATVNGMESSQSNEASATPEQQETEEPTTPEPSGNRAILVVTMTTGLEKEFDLSMKEVNDFIAWYEAKQAGTGKASYAIDKHDNNKGPFSSRKDYILFDRVLTFEVSEYQ